MSTRRAASLRAIAEVAAALGDVRDRVVFVGGAVAALYAPEEGVDIRPTIDVDCVVDVTTSIEHYAFLHELRALGFAECADEGAPTCRRVCGGIRVDVMPAADTAIGPTNRWYAEAMREAAEYDAAGVRVRAITPLYFVATKLEAFYGRGAGDYVASHDLEDVFAVLAGIRSLRDEIARGVSGVARTVRDDLAKLMMLEAFREAIAGHFEGHADGQVRAERIAAWLRTLAAT